MKRVVAPLVAVILASGLVACQQDAPEPTSTPASQLVTPTPGGSSAGSPASTAPSGSKSPGTGSSAEAALLKEAEAVYRSYVAETLKLEAAGGAEKLPPVFDKYVMEPYRTTVETSYQNLLATGATIEKTDQIQVAELRRIAHEGEAGAVVALSACLDGSRAIVRKADGTTEQGSVVMRRLFFKRGDDKVLRIFSSQAERVSTCA